MSLDNVLVLLLHLFMEEPITSPVLKNVMKNVFGPVSSFILHRIYKVLRFSKSCSHRGIVKDQNCKNQPVFMLQPPFGKDY